MDVSKFDGLGKKRVAVAYLVSHIDEVPDDLNKLFVKLKGYEESVSNTAQAAQQAKKSLESLQAQFKELLVSVNTIVEMIVDDLPEDKIAEWCEKYEPQKNPNATVTVPNSATAAPASQEVDMAGATARNLPPVPTVSKK